MGINGLEERSFLEENGWTYFVGEGDGAFYGVTLRFKLH